MFVKHPSVFGYQALVRHLGMSQSKERDKHEAKLASEAHEQAIHSPSCLHRLLNSRMWG